MMNDFPFGQKLGSAECGWRCVYAILRSYGRIDADYDTFRLDCTDWYGRKSAYQADIYELLEEGGIQFGSSFPTPSGTYILFYPVGKDMFHSVVYQDQVVYDSERTESVFVNIRSLIRNIRPKNKPNIYRGLICIEIFGCSDSHTLWQRKNLHSRPSSFKKTASSARAYSSMANYLIGASTKRVTKTLCQWVHNTTGYSSKR